jgi:rod shape-determining protein MreD
VKPLGYLAVLLVGAALAPWLHRVAIGGVPPDLLLLLALYPTLRWGFRQGYWIAWSGGLVVDLQSLGTGLPHCLLYLAAAYGISVARQILDLDRYAVSAVLAMGAAALALGNLGALALWVGPGAEAMPLLLRSLAGALYTATITPVLFLMLGRLPLEARPREAA